MIINDFGDSEGSDYECPACGRSFDTLRGMKNHHSQFCEEAGDRDISGTEVECDECGRRYRMNPAEARKYDQHFCDDDCKGEWQSRELVGEKAAAWKGGPAVDPCANCGADVERKRAVAEDYDKAFCDFGCRGEWREEHFVGEDNPNGAPRVTITCPWCEDGFDVAPWIAESRERAFCSSECYNTFRSEKFSGDGNPNWQGGSDHKYGYYWPEQRDKALERDAHECVVCGDGPEELGRNPAVHHIVPKDTFGSLRAAHQLGNLVTLCPMHHGLAEHGSIQTPTPDSPLTPQTD